MKKLIYFLFLTLISLPRPDLSANTIGYIEDFALAMIRVS